MHAPSESTGRQELLGECLRRVKKCQREVNSLHDERLDSISALLSVTQHAIEDAIARPVERTASN
jgi:hypothetical protein